MKKYLEYDTYNENELPPANTLSKIIEAVNCSTYPPNILARRVNFLTKEERLKCNKEWNRIYKSIEKIDNIISNRAQIKNDPWKIIKV